ncbi:MAG TPA: cupin domain-containing protein, partial [Ideonella sp.]|nr:cupin domain-containing protein [Ideonella sp.]
MNVTRFDAAPEYAAPNHFDMRCVRLQGREAGPAEQLWLGVSTLAPGGHTTLDASPIEKHYVVLEGEL